MNFWQRIKNLWKLSESQQIPKAESNEIKLDDGSTWKITKAQIIKRKHDPVGEIVNSK